MRKIWKRIVICACIPVLFWTYRLISDKQQLRQEIIRFHVVAHSDAPQDQAVKLEVRDAVLAGIRKDLEAVADVEEAKAYLRENLPRIREIADATLERAGFSQRSVVSLCEEAFDRRIYDSFSLPAGVYEALRITIGEGQGHNWWCVTFPNLCLPGTGKEFSTVAAGAGFSGELTETLEKPERYELRFFLLDALGKTENNLFSRK